MKLLFDENLSPKLPKELAALFPDSAHVRDCGLLGQPDEDIWDYARVHGFIVVSKDSDFQQRGLLHGNPPKLVWLRLGNCTRRQVVQLVSSREQDIRALATNPLETVLILT